MLNVQKKFDLIKIILTMKFMFFSYAMVTLKSETLLCINTPKRHGAIYLSTSKGQLTRHTRTVRNAATAWGPKNKVMLTEKDLDTKIVRD